MESTGYPGWELTNIVRSLPDRKEHTVIGFDNLARISLAIVATVTWYGPFQTDGNPFTASYWHSELCEDMPFTVDYQYPGVATASRDIPFCTKVKFEVINVPSWAREEYSYLIGNKVTAVVVDRLRDEDGSVDFDLWPAAAEVLMGSDYKRVGVVYVIAEFDKNAISHYNLGVNRYVKSRTRPVLSSLAASSFCFLQLPR